MNNKIRIISAVILAISTAATVLSSCGENTPEIPVETAIGTNGEILGVSVYTEENNSETQTWLYEITTKKRSIFGKKNKEAENNTPTQSDPKAPINGKSTAVALIPQKENVNTSRLRPTFPPTITQKSTRVVPSFGDSDGQVTKHVPVSYVPQSKASKTTKKDGPATDKPAQPINNTTKKAGSNEKINDESNGVSIVFKTNPVEKGGSASVMIQGEPGKKYSIDFYSTPTEAANLSALADRTADENGFVTWTFIIPMNCESGNRKIIVKENGSANYAQTSINIK